MAKYAGHRSWNAWNVSLWLRNDENLYRLLREIGEQLRDDWDQAAYEMLKRLPAKTPDGARYNATCVAEVFKTEFGG